MHWVPSFPAALPAIKERRTRISLSAIVLAAAAVVLTACSEPMPPTVPRETRESGPSPNLSGTFHLVWGDPPRGLGTPQAAAFLSDSRGITTRISLPAELQSDFGRLSALDGRKVTLAGEMQQPARVGETPVFRASMIMPAERLSEVAGTVQTGSKKYLVILCKFPDKSGDAFGPAAYRKWIGQGDVSRTYPSINHYWYEQSYGKVNFDNSLVVPASGWYTMPHNRSYYLAADTTVPSGVYANLTNLLLDCTAQANPDVNFPDYIGVVVQFNDYLDCCSWGGVGYSLNYDGQNKTYGTAWMASWADQSVYAHESGHSLSLPHSGLDASHPYNSDWDVMSNAYIYYNSGITPNSYVGEGIPAYDKNWLGWIPGTRKIAVGVNSTRTMFVDQLDLPASAKTSLMATVPYGVSTDYYTVESRRLSGYDAHLLAQGVIVHQISPSRGEGVGGKPIFIKYKSLTLENGYMDAAAGAAYQPSESFTDGTHNLTVHVDSSLGTGYVVTITNGNPANSWNAETAPATARSNAFAAAAGNELFVMGGIDANGLTTRVDAYDVRTDRWRNRAALPGAVSKAATVTYNGSIWVFGGKWDVGVGNNVWRFSPATNHWIQKNPMTGYGACGGAAVIGTRIYVFVGCNDGTDHAALLYRYTPASDSWALMASGARPHSGPVVAAVNGKLYVAGGLGLDGNPSTALDIYDPNSNSWSQGAAMPVAMAVSAGGSYNGHMYLAGGFKTLTTLVGLTYVYDPTGNTWTSKAPILTKRGQLSGAFVGAALYTVGGESATGTLLRSVEVYHP